MANVLIIDDDTSICEMLVELISQLGHKAVYTLTAKDGLRGASSQLFDVIFLDVNLPDGNGLQILPALHDIPSSPEIIIITGAGDPDGAELAIKSGAWDYIEKPSSIEAMGLPLIRALQYRATKAAIKPPVALKREGIIGNSARLRASFDLLAQASKSEANVLITGETGTGKELFARAIHENSQRAEENFVVVDCTSLPETLVESVLFGYEKGAYTGADKARDGLIKQADRGTLFLDEVAELPLSLQKAFLRVLQERRFRTIGGKQEIESRFRLIAATHRNLQELVEKGEFRQDLMYRLQSLVIELPPLREHSEDIRELTIYHMDKICKRYRTGTKGFSPEFFEALAAYDWPGNIRELVNTLENVFAAAPNESILFAKHLPLPIRVKIMRASIKKKDPAPGKPKKPTDSTFIIPKLREFRAMALAEVEKKYLENLMAHARGNIQEACALSGLSRPRLYWLLKKYQLSRTT